MSRPSTPGVGRDLDRRRALRGFSVAFAPRAPTRTLERGSKTLGERRWDGLSGPHPPPRPAHECPVQHKGVRQTKGLAGRQGRRRSRRPRPRLGSGGWEEVMEGGGVRAAEPAVPSVGREEPVKGPKGQAALARRETVQRSVLARGPRAAGGVPSDPEHQGEDPAREDSLLVALLRRRRRTPGAGPLLRPSSPLREDSCK